MTWNFPIASRINKASPPISHSPKSITKQQLFQLTDRNTLSVLIFLAFGEEKTKVIPQLANMKLDQVSLRGVTVLFLQYDNLLIGSVEPELRLMAKG